MVHLKLGEVEDLALQMGLKGGRHFAELSGFQAGMPQALLALAPDFLDRVLLGVMGCKCQQCNAPVLW